MAKGIIYVMSTELFALDIRDVQSLLSSLDGKLIYPKNKSKEEVFSESILRGDNKDKINKNLNKQLQVYNDSKSNNNYKSMEVSEENKNNYNLDQKITKQFKNSLECVPTGMYYLKRKIKGYDNFVEAKALVYNGVMTVLKNSNCTPEKYRKASYKKYSEKLKGSVLQEDIEFISASSASSFVIGNSSNGWDDWKDEKGLSISRYRKK